MEDSDNICYLKVTGQDIRQLARFLFELDIQFFWCGCELILGQAVINQSEGRIEIIPMTNKEKFSEFLKRRKKEYKLKIEEIWIR